MRIIQGGEFDSYWKNNAAYNHDEEVEISVKKIIAAVRTEGDAAVRKFASQFDKSSPARLEVPFEQAQRALEELRSNEPSLAQALELSAQHIKRFSEKQKEQFSHFEYEMEPGLVTGQRIIPVERVAVYIPGGRFPLFSSVLMCMIPAFCAGVEEVILASPPTEDGLPDRKILAAAAIAAKVADNNNFGIFAIGGAQAIAALALGTESVPRVDLIAGPGNKYVAAAKRLLFGETGIDFIAGPTDVLIIADGQAADGGIEKAADLAAADMLAQAEHDPDARARALVPNTEFAEKIAAAVEKRLKTLPTEKTARASVDSGGLIIIYKTQEEAIRIANTIAPEHLELQTVDADIWVHHLKNYGSLFIGSLSAEVLGDYSAGINHTLPTSTSARFTGGLSVRHFLKTVTTLRCASGEDFEKTRNAAEILARAEGLEGHAESAVARARE
ncbi:MAG: histidinol dehydrogenase [Treponema sp.]|jgi:histidinol dehydrogenase|nr:histidinol dehydrogenase [Treponema sp.]